MRISLAQRLRSQGFEMIGSLNLEADGASKTLQLASVKFFWGVSRFGVSPPWAGFCSRKSYALNPNRKPLPLLNENQAWKDSPASLQQVRQLHAESGRQRSGCLGFRSLGLSVRNRFVLLHDESVRQRLG